MRKIICLVLSLLMIIGLSACGKDTTETDENNSANTTHEEAKTIDINEAKWTDFAVKINDVVVKFPCSVKEFEKTGFIINDQFANIEIQPGGTTSTTFYISSDAGFKNGVFDFYNPENQKTGKSRLGKDCLIQGGSFNRLVYNNIIYAGGITLDSSAEELIKAWGEPTEKLVDTYLYKVDKYQYIYVNFYEGMTDKISDIQIVNTSKNDWTE